MNKALVVWGLVILILGLIGYFYLTATLQTVALVVGVIGVVLLIVGLVKKGAGKK